MRSWCLVVALGVLCGAAQGEEPDYERLLLDLGSADAAVRERARRDLSGAGAAAAQFLARGVRSENPARAAACADLIGTGGLRGGRRAIVAVLGSKETGDLVARAACRTLGRVGDYRDLGLLTGFLGRFPEAAEALAELGERDALPALNALAGKGEAHPSVFYALAALGADEGFVGLIDRLDGADGPEAGRYLRRLTGREEGTGKAGWSVWWRQEKLARRLGHSDWGESERALTELVGGGAGPVISAEEMGDLLTIASDARRTRDARVKAVLALGLARDRRALAGIVDILNKDEDGMVRVYAAEAVGRIGEADSAVDLCAYLIFDEEPFRKRSLKDAAATSYYAIDSEICKSLVKLGVNGGLDFLIRQLGENHRVRIFHQAVGTLRAATGQSHGFRPDGSRQDKLAAAARWRRWFDENRGAIGLEGPAASGNRRLRERIKGLVETLDTFHFLTMSRARQTLTLLGEVALPELLEGLDSPAPKIRVHCSEILAWIRCKAARTALARSLEHERPEVRVAVVAALGEIGPGDQAGAVLDALRDDDLDVRISAAHALVRVERSKAVPALTGALRREENRSKTFRREAYYTLAAHGEAAAVDWLAAMLGHQDIAFRQLVADRIEALTGLNPGVESASMEEWRRWWRVSRERYTFADPDRTSR